MDPYSLVMSSVAANNAWSAAQAQKQMDFQREMSNTAHVREVEDLKAAGLNPVLSASQGGASTPSGAMANGDTSGTSALVHLLTTFGSSIAHSAASGAKATQSLQTVEGMSDWLRKQNTDVYSTKQGVSSAKEYGQAVYDSAREAYALEHAPTIKGSTLTTIGQLAGLGLAFVNPKLGSAVMSMARSGDKHADALNDLIRTKISDAVYRLDKEWESSKYKSKYD